MKKVFIFFILVILLLNGCSASKESSNDLAQKQEDRELYLLTIDRLKSKGVEIKDIAEIVMYLESDRDEDLTIDYCMENVEEVISKTEVSHAIITGIELDELAENKQLSPPLQDLIEEDRGIYSIDESLVLSIAGSEGSRGLINFGYLDKDKVGITKDLDDKKKEPKGVNTYTDNIVSAIASAAASRVRYLRD